MNQDQETVRVVLEECPYFQQYVPVWLQRNLAERLLAALAASRAEGEGQAEQCHAALTEVGIPELVRVGHAVEVLSARGRIFLLAGQRNEAKAECDTLRVQLGGAERHAAALRAKLRMMASEAESVNRRDLDAIADAPFSRDLLRRCYVTLTETEAAAQAHHAAVAREARREMREKCEKLATSLWVSGGTYLLPQTLQRHTYSANISAAIRALGDDGPSGEGEGE